MYACVHMRACVHEREFVCQMPCTHGMGTGCSSLLWKHVLHRQTGLAMLPRTATTELCLSHLHYRAQDGHSLDHHPLGTCVESAGGSCRNNFRKPNVLVTGVDSVLGASPFLSQAPCPEFVARSNVEVYELYKASSMLQPGSEKRDRAKKDSRRSEVCMLVVCARV